MNCTKQDILDCDRIKRLNIINSISGIKPGNLIGSISDKGTTNLAIISSVVHLSSNPPLIGFIMRPRGEVKRDTYNNIRENHLFTINHIPTSHIEQAHYTSAKFDTEISEFDRCGFTPEYIEGFKAPFVKESKIKMGLELVEEIPIPSSKTTMIVGEIQHLMLPDNTMNETGFINLEQADTAGIAGLNSYYKLQFLDSFPYARVEDVPTF
ncbi:MAG: flavin reductase (DIM6/NTAB) family NADH-FMN oxidoreductase RutF [Salibacteraceae bacterium]|jgi:flavin reductase (DIM6/NTAB) family NADH-FMN oxidoreductase RutF|tara:strand:- start:93 stop:722 length:630 start_codon:yes stop_codon:yes gene_type:complete